MSWDFDTTKRPAARGTRADHRGAPTLTTTTTRHDFDERRENDLLERCIESYKEKKNSDLLRLAINRVDPKVIEHLEADMKAQVAAVDSRHPGADSRHPAAASTTAFGEPVGSSLFQDTVSLEFKSGNITGKRQDKLLRSSTLSLA